MIGNRLRSIRILTAVIVVLPLLFAGCFFNLSEKKDFKSWYYGDPGMAGALGEENCDPYADNIQGKRHPYYLHFRTPEILLQPQGGAHYPERTTDAGRADESPPTCEKVAKGWETFHFDTVDAGLVDVVIPYRKASAVNDREKGFGQESLAYAEGVVYNTGLTAVMKAPIYIVHDILKTLYIPVAGTYYLFNPDASPETPAEIIQVRDEPPLGETPSAETDRAGAPTGSDLEAKTPLPVPSADTSDAGDEDTHDGETEAVGSSPSVGDDDTVVVAQAEPGDVASDAPAEGDDVPSGVEDSAVAEGTELPVIEETGAAVPAESEKVRDVAEDKIAAAEMPPEAVGPAVPGADETEQDFQTTEARSEGDPLSVPAEGEMPVSPEEPAPVTTTATEDLAAPSAADDENGAGVQADVPATDRKAVVVSPTGPPDAALPEDDMATPMGEGTETAPSTVTDPDTLSAETAIVAPAPEDGSEVEAPSAPKFGPAEPDIQASSEAEPTPVRPAEPASEAPISPETAVAAPSPATADADTIIAAPAGPGDETAETSHAAIADAPAEAVEDPPVEEPPELATAEDEAMISTSEATPGFDETTEESAVADGSAQPGVQADIPEEDRVGGAAAALAAIARGGPGTTTGESRPEGAPAPRPDVAPGGEIVEEDLLTATEGAGKAPGQSREAVPPPTGEAPEPIARVSPAQTKVAAEAPTPLEALQPVRISKRKLRKKVAFLGFTSRAVNVGEKTKTYMRERLWPVMEKECQKNLSLVRRGDADYPASLDALIRDQFGHLNSFELTTVARFSGLNAIISGTIIDIRVSKELSGILWYKTPEGRLRLTILVEVYDAETGTKLLDQTYIREEEVEELEPGADETLRDEDLPILEAALRSVAEEMGEQVCEALEDQPWRAFVSGINGDRITLSAGQNAGLVPGNILGVYNSQIIDGLNNQQFFLTGEKVGRVQIINVFANRSEAILIEGRGLRDYSVAIPE